LRDVAAGPSKVRFPPIAVVRLRRHRWILTKRRLRPRRALFDETGTVLPRLAVELDETLAPLGWVLGVGSRTAAGEVSPDDASPAAHLDAPLLAALRPAAPLLVSRQIVVQLLSQVEKSRPTLVLATRALVGEQRAGSAMVTELLEGRSLRNLPPFLEALVRRSGEWLGG
jgi:hypothetical protein